MDTQHPIVGTVLALDDDHIKLIVIGSFVVGGILLYSLIQTIGSVLKTREREKTRRDIAAFVAEGTMTPETADKFLNSSGARSWEDQVAKLMSDGLIDSDEAEKLLKAGPKTGPVPQAASPASA